MRRDSKENDERLDIPEADLHHLVNVLNDWVNRINRSTLVREKCDCGQLLVSVYSRLVAVGLLDGREVDSLAGWIDGLRNRGQRIISLH